MALLKVATGARSWKTKQPNSLTNTQYAPSRAQRKAKTTIIVCNRVSILQHVLVFREEKMRFNTINAFIEKKMNVRRTGV